MKQDRLKLFFKEDFDFTTVIQKEDDLASLFKLYGPFDEVRPEFFPPHEYIEVHHKMQQVYYQKKTQIPYLVQLLQHHLRFESLLQKDEVIQIIQMRCQNFLERLTTSSARSLIDVYFKEEDSAKELFNAEIDSSKSFNSVFRALKDTSSGFVVN